MICPTCEGRKGFGLRGREQYGRPMGISCPDCDGTGQVDDRYPEWRTRGAAMKRARLDGREVLVDYCRRRGIDVMERSRMERGLIEPTEVM